MKIPLSEIKLPFSTIHNVMTYLGFSRIGFNRHSAYRARFDDTSTKRSYRFMIPVQDHTVTCSVKIAKAFFEDHVSVPPEVVEAAESKLSEINAYLQDERERQNRKAIHRFNGMAPNMEEIVKLGKHMATMKTNQELREAGKIPDPIQ